MGWTPDILIGNTNTYQVLDLRDSITGDLATDAEVYLSLCESPVIVNGQNSQVVTNATNTPPIVITSANHGLTTGDVITIVNVGGNGAAKGTFTVTVVDANTFSLDGSVGDGAYDGGGQWYRCLDGASALALTNLGDGNYSVDIDGSIGLLPQTVYVAVFYCLGTYRDVFNDIVRLVARVRGSN